MSKPKSKALRFISRIEQGKFKTWWVRVGEYTDHYSQKSFPDSRHNGKLKALKAAQNFRDKEQKRLYKIHNIVLPRQTSRTWGIGVHLAVDKRRNTDIFAWRATYYDKAKKKQLVKSFSIHKYGTRRAKDLAIQWRELKITGELNDIN